MLALGNTACSRVTALRLLTPAEAGLQTPGAALLPQLRRGDLLLMVGEEERGTSPGMAVPRQGRGQCQQPQRWGARGVTRRHHRLPLGWGQWGGCWHLHSCAEPFPSQWCQTLQQQGQSKDLLSPPTGFPAVPGPAANGLAATSPRGLLAGREPGCTAWGGCGPSRVLRHAVPPSCCHHCSITPSCQEWIETGLHWHFCPPLVDVQPLCCPAAALCWHRPLQSAEHPALPGGERCSPPPTQVSLPSGFCHSGPSGWRLALAAITRVEERAPHLGSLQPIATWINGLVKPPWGHSWASAT